MGGGWGYCRGKGFPHGGVRERIFRTGVLRVGSVSRQESGARALQSRFGLGGELAEDGGQLENGALFGGGAEVDAGCA